MKLTSPETFARIRFLDWIAERTWQPMTDFTREQCVEAFLGGHLIKMDLSNPDRPKIRSIAAKTGDKTKPQ